MQRLYPDRQDDPDDDDLARTYAWPPAADGPADSTANGAAVGSDGRARVRANMVASLDGRASVAGSSSALSNPADQRLLVLLRDLADLVLIGAGTARAERYPGIRSDPDRRRRWGFAGSPPVAVLTRGGIESDLPLFTDTEVRPLVITSERGAAGLRALPATVLTAGTDDLDLAAALRTLAELGYRRVHCEGGPTVLGQLLTAGLLDELCLAIAPALIGTAGIDLLGGIPVPGQDRVGWRLDAVHQDRDHLFSLYRRSSGSVE